MGLDIRIPLGMIFLVLGAIMTVFGFFTHGDAMYERSLGIDLNLVWGLIMLAFGAIMFFIGRRQKWQDDPVDPRPWESPDKTHLRH